MKKRIDEITDNFDNKRKPLNGREREQKSKEKKYPYYGANGIVDYIDEYLFDEELLCIAEDGGSWGANQKCAYIINGKCWVNNHAHVLKPKPGINIRYLMYYLNYKNLNSSISGAVVRKLTQKALNELEIEIPEELEQKRIVEELDLITSGIKNREEGIEIIDKIISNKFIKLYSGNYKMIELQDLVDVRDGTHSSPKYLDSGNYILITSKNINNGVISFDDIKYISEKDYNEINKRSLVEIGDILMPMIGTIGNPVIIFNKEKEFAIKNVALFKKSDKLIPEVLYEYLKSQYFFSYVKKKNKGGIQKFLALNDIRKMPFKDIPRESQEEFYNDVTILKEYKSKLEKDMDYFNRLLLTKTHEFFQ